MKRLVSVIDSVLNTALRGEIVTFTCSSLPRRALRITAGFTGRIHDAVIPGADVRSTYRTSLRVSVATNVIPSSFMSHKMPIICGRSSSVPTANRVFSICDEGHCISNDESGSAASIVCGYWEPSSVTISKFPPGKEIFIA